MNNAVTMAQLQRWAADAHAALAQARVDLAAEPVRQLAAQLPNDPDVLLLRRWLAMIEFGWPHARKTGAFGPRQPPPSNAVDLVLFHVDLAASPSGFHAGFNYLEVAALSFEAAMRFAPQARRILITDERTHVPDGTHAHEVIRRPIDTTRVMYERMRLQEEFLAARPSNRCTVFMDVDIVTNRDPALAFAHDFDVGLTWRAEFPDAPINGGLILVGPGEGGRAFFREARACYSALATDASIASLFDRDLRHWWGDQFVLAVMVGYREFVARRSDCMTVGLSRMKLLPCAEYNFTPEAGQHYTEEFLTSRWFLHFKGNRKPLQSQYLDFIRAKTKTAPAQ